MTPTTLPPLVDQSAVHDAWRTLMGELGFSRQSLWLLFIGADDRADGITKVDDMPRQPGPRDHDAIGRILDAAVPPGHRVACLISRPGRDGLSVPDRRWAAALIATCREAGIASEMVHRANDVDIVPVTLDDLPSGARRLRPA